VLWVGKERERETATPRGRALCDLPLAGADIQSTVELRCEHAYRIALDYTLRRSGYYGSHETTIELWGLGID